MTRTMDSRKFLVLAAALFAALLTLSNVASAAQAQDVSAAVHSKLNKSQYKDVQVNVDANGVATLTGTVSLYEYKADADKNVHKVKGVTAVRNDIQSPAPRCPTASWRKASEKSWPTTASATEMFSTPSHCRCKMAWSRWAVPRLITQAATLRSASSLPRPESKTWSTRSPWIPLSPMDNQIRIDVARAVYGFPSLNRYAIDPAKPIRIAVQNGNVALYGVVDSEADKDAAFIRANGVPGVFSVKNYLQVANQPTESKK